MAIQNPFGDPSVVATVETMTTSPAQLFGLSLSNLTSIDAYFQVFDALAANVTVGTTTPNLIFLVPAGNGTIAGGFDRDWPVGLRFITGMSYAATTSPTGNTAPGTGLTLSGWYS